MDDILTNVKQIRDSHRCAVGLNQLQSALKTGNVDALLSELAQKSPQLQELQDLWDAQITSQNQAVIEVILVTLSELFIAVSQLPRDPFHQPAWSAVTCLAEGILTRRLKGIYYSLSSGARTRSSAALHLLAALASLGPTLTGELVRSFDFSHSALPTLARHPKPSKDEDPASCRQRQHRYWQETDPLKRPTRAAFVSFAQAVLKSADPITLSEVLGIRPLVSGLLHHVASDPVGSQHITLGLLQDRVLSQKMGVAPAVRADAFSVVALVQLANIAASAPDITSAEEDTDDDEADKEASSDDRDSDSSSDEEADKAGKTKRYFKSKDSRKKRNKALNENQGAGSVVQQVAQRAHALVLSLCTDPRHGLTQRGHRLLGPGSGFMLMQAAVPLTPHSRTLLRWLLLLKPSESKQQYELVEACTAANPDVAAAFLLALPYNLEPTATGRWLAHSTLTAGVIRQLAGVSPGLEELAQRGQAAPSMKGRALQAMLRLLSPPAVPRAALSRGVQHANALVRHATLTMLCSILQLLESIVNDAVRATGIAGSQQEGWQELVRGIAHVARTGLPDIQPVLAQLTSATSADASNKKENGDNDVDINDVGEKESVSVPSALLTMTLRTLRGWCHALPDAFTAGHIELERLIPTNPLSLPNLHQYQYIELLLSSPTLKPINTSCGIANDESLAAVVSAPPAHLLPVLRLLASAPRGEVRTAAWTWLHARLFQTGLFDGNNQEVAVWLDLLPETPAVGSFAAEAMGLVQRRPDEFWDQDQQQQYNQQAEYSLFMLCMLRQALRILPSGKMPSEDKAAIAVYVSAAACALLMQQVRGGQRLKDALLDVISKETARFADSTVTQKDKEHNKAGGSSAMKKKKKRKLDAAVDGEALLQLPALQVDEAEPLRQLITSLLLQPSLDANGTEVKDGPAAKKQKKKDKKSRSSSSGELHGLTSSVANTAANLIQQASDLCLESSTSEFKPSLLWCHLSKAWAHNTTTSIDGEIAKDLRKLLAAAPYSQCAAALRVCLAQPQALGGYIELVFNTASKASQSIHLGSGLVNHPLRQCTQLLANTSQETQKGTAGADGVVHVLQQLPDLYHKVGLSQKDLAMDVALLLDSTVEAIKGLLVVLADASISDDYDTKEDVLNRTKDGGAATAVRSFTQLAPLYSGDTLRSVVELFVQYLEGKTGVLPKGILSGVGMFGVQAAVAAAGQLVHQHPTSDGSDLDGGGLQLMVSALIPLHSKLLWNKLKKGKSDDEYRWIEDFLAKALSSSFPSSSSAASLPAPLQEDLLATCLIPERWSPTTSQIAAALVVAHPSTAAPRFATALSAVLKAAERVDDKAKRRVTLALCLAPAVAAMRWADGAPAAAVAEKILSPLLGFLSSKHAEHVKKDSSSSNSNDDEIEKAGELLYRHAVPALALALTRHQVTGPEWGKWLIKLLPPTGWPVDKTMMNDSISSSNSSYSLAPSVVQRAQAVGVLLKQAPVPVSPATLVPFLTTYRATLIALNKATDAAESNTKNFTQHLERLFLSEFDSSVGEAIAALPSSSRSSSSFSVLMEGACELATGVLRRRAGDEATLCALRRLMAAFLPDDGGDGFDDEMKNKGDSLNEGGNKDEDGSSSDDSSDSDSYEGLATAGANGNPHNNAAANKEQTNRKLDFGNDVLMHDAADVSNPQVASAATALFLRLITHSRFTACMRCAEASPPPLPHAVRAVPRPLHSVLAFADCQLGVDVSAAPALPHLKSTSSVPLMLRGDEEDTAYGGEAARLKKELCELLETLLDIEERFTPADGAQPSSSNSTGSALKADLQAAEPGLLKLLMATYGGSLSAADVAAWGLIQELNLRVWKRQERPGSHSIVTGNDDGGDDDEVDALLHGPIAQSGFVWGPAAMNAAPTSVDESIAPTLGQIDAVRCALTAVHFPDQRTLTALPTTAHTAAPPSDATPSHMTTEHGVLQPSQPVLPPYSPCGYDPAFLLPLCITALRSKAFPLRHFAGSGLLSVCLRGLAAEDGVIRGLAYEAMGLMHTLLNELGGQSSTSIHTQRQQTQNQQQQHHRGLGDFKERQQLSILLDVVRNTIPRAFFRLPALHAVFFAEAALCLVNPGSLMYPAINKLLLKAPALNLNAVPLVGRLLMSGAQHHAAERTWGLKLMAVGVRGVDDAMVGRRHHVLELVMATHDMAVMEPAVVQLALRVVCNAVLVPRAARHLVDEAAGIDWLTTCALHAVQSTLQGAGSSTLNTTSSNDYASASTSYAGERSEAEAAVRVLHALHQLSTLNVVIKARGARFVPPIEDLILSIRRVLSLLSMLCGGDGQGAPTLPPGTVAAALQIWVAALGVAVNLATGVVAHQTEHDTEDTTKHSHKAAANVSLNQLLGVRLDSGRGKAAAAGAPLDLGEVFKAVVGHGQGSGVRRALQELLEMSDTCPREVVFRARSLRNLLA